MRQILLLAAALLAQGAGKPETEHYFLQFGATPTSPIGPPVPCAAPTPGHELCPYLEPDYIPNYEAVVPQTTRSCGASFVRFEPLTEGAERAFFDISGDRPTAVVDCIRQHLPQGHVARADDRIHP